MEKFINVARRLNWALALVLALIAAFVFRSGYEELAAVIWFAALAALLPIWRG